MQARRIHRTASAIAALSACLAIGSALGGISSAAANPTLYVNYAMNCTFTITDDAGKTVTAIAPGSYQIAVSTPTPFGGVSLSGSTDMTACQGFVQFQLTGPGVSLSTTLDDGDGAFDLLTGTFKPSSTYVAVDANQPSVARVAFTTLASGTASSPATTTIVPAPAPSGSKPPVNGGGKQGPVGTLSGSIGSTGKLALTFKGKPVTRLQAGLYTVSVSDGSSKAGLVFRRAGASATTVTGVAFVGKWKTTLTLAAGRWFYSATASGRKAYFTVS